MKIAKNGYLISVRLRAGLACVGVLFAHPVRAMQSSAPELPSRPPVKTALLSQDRRTDLAGPIASIASAGWPSMSPDGKHVAYVSTESGRAQVWILSTDGDAPRQVTNGADPVSTVNWSPDGDWLAYSALPGGSNSAQIYVVRPDGSADRRITPQGGETNELIGWTADGKRLLASSNVDETSNFQPLLLDPMTGARTKVGGGGGYSSLSAVSADARWALVSRSSQTNDSNVLLVDIVNGRERVLTPHVGAGDFWAAAICPDARHAWVTGPIDGGDRVALGHVALDGKGGAGPVVKIAARDDAELEFATFSSDCMRALLVWNVAGRSELEWLDVTTGRRTPGPALPVDLVRTAQVTHNGAVIAGRGATRPDDLYRIDQASGSIAQLTRSRHDGVDLDALVRPTLFHYKAHDQLPLSGWLYRPRGVTDPGPVVVMFHGGPEAQARPELNAYIQTLVARGIGVFAPNVRGSTGFGRRFASLDNGAKRVDAIGDIADTARALVTAAIADPARIGIKGQSFGGYMVLAGITAYPEMFAAAVDLYGISDFETYFADAQPWIRSIATVEYGDPVSQRALLRQLSPYHRLHAVRTPLLILHGENDRNVPIGESERAHDRLRALGRPVEMIRFAGEGHGFQQASNRATATRSIADFFTRHLGR